MEIVVDGALICLSQCLDFEKADEHILRPKEPVRYASQVIRPTGASSTLRSWTVGRGRNIVPSGLFLNAEPS